MTVTQLSKELNISRAVIYRVLNNEPYVSEKVRTHVLDAIRKYGCVPNQMGKGLVLCRQKTRIVALFHEPEYFFRRICEGMDKTMDRFKDSGIELEIRKVFRQEGENGDESAMEKALEEIAGGPKITALILMSPRNDRIEQLVRQIAAKGTIVATLTTDLPHSDRLFFVGQDSHKSGRVVGQMLLSMYTCRNILMFPGRRNNECHDERMAGLREYFAESRTNAGLTVCDNDMDTTENAFRCVDEALCADPTIDAVVVISRGIKGVAQALKKHGAANRVRVIAFDRIPDNEQYLKDGVLDLIIEQSPVNAGSMVMELLYNYLMTNQNKPPEIVYTDTTLVVRELLD